MPRGGPPRPPPSGTILSKPLNTGKPFGPPLGTLIQPKAQPEAQMSQAAQRNFGILVEHMRRSCRNSHLGDPLKDSDLLTEAILKYRMLELSTDLINAIQKILVGYHLSYRDPLVARLVDNLRGIPQVDHRLTVIEKLQTVSMDILESNDLVRLFEEACSACATPSVRMFVGLLQFWHAQEFLPETSFKFLKNLMARGEHTHAWFTLENHEFSEMELICLMMTEQKILQACGDSRETFKGLLSPKDSEALLNFNRRGGTSILFDRLRENLGVFRKMVALESQDWPEPIVGKWADHKRKLTDINHRFQRVMQENFLPIQKFLDLPHSQCFERLIELNLYMSKLEQNQESLLQIYLSAKDRLRPIVQPSPQHSKRRLSLSQTHSPDEPPVKLPCSPYQVEASPVRCLAHSPLVALAKLVSPMAANLKLPGNRVHLEDSPCTPTAMELRTRKLLKATQGTPKPSFPSPKLPDLPLAVDSLSASSQSDIPLASSPLDEPPRTISPAIISPAFDHTPQSSDLNLTDFSL